LDSLQVKNAIFYPDKVVILYKKEEITINVEDIDFMTYVKPTMWNKIFAGIGSVTATPEYLYIFLNKKINKRKMYSPKVPYKDFVNLPKYYLDHVRLR